MFRRWAESIGQNLLFVILVAILPGSFVAYLARVQSTWTYPILIGTAIGALVSVALLAILAIRRLPPKRLIPTLDNIQECVRTWLDKFHVTVKNAPDDACYFRVLATFDSGTKMLVGRPRNQYSDYVIARADIKATEEEQATFKPLSEKEKKRVIVSAQLELARRNVGFSGLELPLDNCYIFKRIPISETLTEHQFIAALDEVEAAVHALAAVLVLRTLDPPASDRVTLKLPV